MHLFPVGMGPLLPHPPPTHKRVGGKAGEIVPSMLSPDKTDCQWMLEVKTLKKELLSLDFHGASGTWGENICF